MGSRRILVALHKFSEAKDTLAANPHVVLPSSEGIRNHIKMCAVEVGKASSAALRSKGAFDTSPIEGEIDAALEAMDVFEREEKKRITHDLAELDVLRAKVALLEAIIESEPDD